MERFSPLGLVFNGILINLLDLGDIGWWEVLEVVDFESVYANNN
jgi:hypothetical protein